MSRGDIPKWIYTFTLLVATLWWARFLVLTVKGVITQPTELGIIEVAGVGVLLGALLSWNANIVQYWFRKAPPKDGTSSGG